MERVNEYTPQNQGYFEGQTRSHNIKGMVVLGFTF